ncbi:hypothetical protein [Rhodococcus koreensis]
MEWFVSFWDLETQRTSVRAGEASDRDDAMAQVIAAGRDLACRDDGSVVNKTAHIRIGTELAVVTGFDNPRLDDENLRCRIEAAITAKQQHARTMQHRVSVELPPAAGAPTPPLDPEAGE